MDNVNRVRVGQLVPDFALKDSEGREVRLSDFQGRKSVLLFFCAGKKSAPCLDWWQELNLLYDEIEGEDIEILALSQDERRTSRQLKKERQIRFPILKIEAEWETFPNTPPVSQRYSVEVDRGEGKGVYPALFLVDKMGIVRYRKVYAHAADGLDTEQLLCELNKWM